MNQNPRSISCEPSACVHGQHLSVMVTLSRDRRSDFIRECNSYILDLLLTRGGYQPMNGRSSFDFQRSIVVKHSLTIGRSYVGTLRSFHVVIFCSIITVVNLVQTPKVSDPSLPHFSRSFTSCDRSWPARYLRS